MIWSYVYMKETIRLSGEVVSGLPYAISVKLWKGQG